MDKESSRNSHTQFTPKAVKTELQSSQRRNREGEDLIGEAYDELENLAHEMNDEGEDDL